MNGAPDKPGITLACCGLIGTVVPDEGLVERCFAEAIATQGVVSGTSAFARRMTQVHQARGQAPGDVLRMLFPDNEARAQAAQLAFDRALGDAIRRVVIQPVAGAVQVLDQLRETGCQIAVLTSLPRRMADAILDAAGLRRSVDIVLSAQDVARGFPAPDLVLTAVLQSGTAAVAEVAVIHGTGAGVDSGRRAGASIVAGVLAASRRGNSHSRQHRGRSRAAAIGRRCRAARAPGRGQRACPDSVRTPDHGTVDAAAS